MTTDDPGGEERTPGLTPEERKKRDEEVRVAVVDAHYRRLLERPEAARRRAQAAYVIASAAAAAVLTAGAFGNLNARPALLQVLGPIVLVAWLACAGLFLWAVAAPYHEGGPATAKGFAALKSAVLDASKNETAEIDKRQRLARYAAALAALLTVLTVVLSLTLPVDHEKKSATVFLDKTAERQLGKACNTSLPDVLQAKIEPATSSGEAVTLDLPGGTCGPEEVESVLTVDDITYVLK